MKSITKDDFFFLCRAEHLSRDYFVLKRKTHQYTNCFLFSHERTRAADTTGGDAPRLPGNVLTSTKELH